MLDAVCILLMLVDPPADPPDPITIEVIQQPPGNKQRLVEGRGIVAQKDAAIRIEFKARLLRPGFEMQITSWRANYDPKTGAWSYQFSLVPYEHEFWAELVTRDANGKEKVTESKKVKFTVMK